jgi:anhydro-N-acetylmuramic acid kinase
MAYSAAIEQYVEATFKDNLADWVRRLSEAFFGEARRSVTLQDVIQTSARLHAEAAEHLLTELGAEAAHVAWIGYHGQTLYHAPFDHITVQVGDPQMLADRLGIPVVFDFRRNDIEHGGQGAPLAPVYHRALLDKAGLPSASILNLGGTANITVASRKSDAIFGFDTGPANGLIDKYVKEKAGLGLDVDSRLALVGSVSEPALHILLERGIRLSDGRNYLEIKPPKSLDIRDYHYDFPEFLRLQIEDGCATLNAFSAECIAIGLDWLDEVPQDWILCGGGARNLHLKSEIQKRVEAKTNRSFRLLSADQAGWSAQGMEAELLAYLAVRSSRGLPLTFPGTTGVSAPLSGGKIFVPRKILK